MIEVEIAADMNHDVVSLEIAAEEDHVVEEDELILQEDLIEPKMTILSPVNSDASECPKKAPIKNEEDNFS